MLRGRCAGAQPTAANDEGHEYASGAAKWIAGSTAQRLRSRAGNGRNSSQGSSGLMQEEDGHAEEATRRGKEG